ncbi:MAG: SxtJ family membrane protein [Pseudomonadota bacterium]
MAKKSTATHEDFARENDIKLPSERSFGITFGVVFALFAGLSFWFDGTLWPWLGGVSAVFGAAGLVWPAVLAPLNKLWFRFGLLLHKVMTPLIMGLLFYGLFTPVGLLMRLTGKDPMRVRSTPDAQSYWIEREPSAAVDNPMKNQF